MPERRAAAGVPRFRGGSTPEVGSGSRPLARLVPGPDAGPVRVMHVLYSLRLGGIEQALVRLTNSIDPKRVVSSVCSCTPADALKNGLDPRVRLFEFNRRDGNDPIFVGQLARLLRREQPTIVHTHNWGTLCEGLLAARLAGVPYVVHTEHGTMETRRRNLLVQRWAWRRLDCLLSVCSPLADRMARQVGYPRNRIRVIRDGVDTSRFTGAWRDTARHDLGLGPDDFVIGTVGRLVLVKDQSTLLNALAVLKVRGVPFRAVVAGDGPLRDVLMTSALRLGIGSSVEFLGARVDIERVMAALDVFVLSSLSEGLPIAILEAMASGLPVVATRVGGVEELVDDGRTGVLVPAGAAGALANALLRLAAEPDRRRAMGAAARQRAEQEFALNKVAQEYEDLYLDLAGRRRPREQAVGAEPVCAR